MICAGDARGQKDSCQVRGFIQTGVWTVVNAVLYLFTDTEDMGPGEQEATILKLFNPAQGPLFFSIYQCEDLPPMLHKHSFNDC
jgi:hypothetical protein